MIPSPLVNCHTHLELGWLASLCPEPNGMTFASWLARLDSQWDELSDSGDEKQTMLRSIEHGIKQLVAVGTTHVGDISNSGHSIAPLLNSGLAGVVYIEIVGNSVERAERSFAKAIQLLEKYRPLERNGMRIGLTPHTPYSVAPHILSKVVAFAQAEKVPICMHVEETPAEREAMVDATGELFDVLNAYGNAKGWHASQASIPYLHNIGILDCQPLLIHMANVTDEEIEIVARSGAKVAHCPRSNINLRCGRMPLEKMLAAGIPVALGTDGLCSSQSLSVTDEAHAAIQRHAGHVAEAEIWTLLQNYSVLS